MEGIKSVMMWVMESETINMDIGKGFEEIIFSKKERDRKVIMRFMCSPGIKPVIVPISTPMMSAIINSKIIHLIDMLELISFYSFQKTF